MNESLFGFLIILLGTDGPIILLGMLLVFLSLIILSVVSWARTPKQDGLVREEFWIDSSFTEAQSEVK